MAGETIVLGKNVSYPGVNNVREGSITTTFTEIDKTKKGDTVYVPYIPKGPPPLPKD